MSKSSGQLIGEESKGAKLPQAFSALKPNVHLLHLSVLRQLNNRRAGTASTKTRSEVRGGGKKPWKQKGTGRARAGSIRSPLWVGGGIAFGPKPRDYNIKINKKARNLALGQALAAKSKELIVIEKIPQVKDSKTKNLVSVIESWGKIEKPITFICSSGEAHFNEIKLAGRNLPYFELVEDKIVSVYEILKAGTVVITKTALGYIEEKISKISKNKKEKVAKNAK